MQIRKLGIIGLGVLLSFALLGTELVAQQAPRPQFQLAILVQAEQPFPESRDVVDSVQDAILDELANSNRYEVIPAGRLTSAVEELDLEISNNSSPREIRDFANQVNADFVILFTIDPAGQRQVRIEAEAFNSRGQSVFEEDSQRLSLNEEGLISRVTTNLLQELLEEI